MLRRCLSSRKLSLFRLTQQRLEMEVNKQRRFEQGFLLSECFVQTAAVHRSASLFSGARKKEPHKCLRGSLPSMKGEKKDTQNKRNPARDKGFEQAKRDSTFEMANLSVGRLYQVDHLQLPYDSPIPKDIEIVMVSKITELKVSLWYSTVDLLRKHFENPERPHFPHLAKRCDMDLRYARALVRMISNEEVATKVDNLRFWTVDSLNEEPLWEIYGRKRGDVEDAEERGMKALPKSKRSRKGKQPSENENTSASSEVEQCLKSLTLAVLSNSGSFLKAFDWDDLDFGSPVSPKVILQRLSNELDNEIAAVDNHKEKLQNFKKKVAEALQALS